MTLCLSSLSFVFVFRSLELRLSRSVSQYRKRWTDLMATYEKDFSLGALSAIQGVMEVMPEEPQASSSSSSETPQPNIGGVGKSDDKSNECKPCDGHHEEEGEERTGKLSTDGLSSACPPSHLYFSPNHRRRSHVGPSNHRCSDYWQSQSSSITHIIILLLLLATLSKRPLCDLFGCLWSKGCSPGTLLTG